MVKAHCYNFRTITAIFSGVQIFTNLMVVFQPFKIISLILISANQISGAKTKDLLERKHLTIIMHNLAKFSHVQCWDRQALSNSVDPD